MIDKEIPYHILFLLEYCGQLQVWIGYKEASAIRQEIFRVDSYYHTEWLPPEGLSLRVEGLDIGALYDGAYRSDRRRAPDSGVK